MQLSFAVLAKNEEGAFKVVGVCENDVAITRLVTSSDASAVKNPKAEVQAQRQILRYKRRMDRHRRPGSLGYLNEDGHHVAVECHWKHLSRRVPENTSRLKKVHAKTAQVRKDAIHKATCRAATTHAMNIVEDLRLEQMGRKASGKSRSTPVDWSKFPNRSHGWV